MAKFLTTRGLSHNLEELIDKAEKNIYLISPYIRFPQTLYERLKHKLNTGVNLTVVYGKTELNSKELSLITNLTCNIYFRENLHAKCYINEKSAIITSLNLHSYSEANNDEMGILLDFRKDHEAFMECLQNVELIISNAKPIRILNNGRNLEKLKTEYDNITFIDNWIKCLSASFPKANFQQIDNYLIAKDFINKGIDFSTRYGIATITFNIEKNYGSRLKDEHALELQNELSDYRLYWKSPYNTFMLYYSKNIEFKNTNDQVKYCADGVSILLSGLKKMNLI